MVAVDTNVLLRLVIGDDEDQLHVAENLLADESIYVPLTVLLEVEWVLRSRYGYSRSLIARSILNLAAMAAITIERRSWVDRAIDRYAVGGDFADYIHLASVADGAMAFATFDRRIERDAGKDRPVPIKVLG